MCLVVGTKNVAFCFHVKVKKIAKVKIVCCRTVVMCYVTSLEKVWARVPRVLSLPLYGHLAAYICSDTPEGCVW